MSSPSAPFPPTQADPAAVQRHFMFTLGQPGGAVADYLTWIRGPGQDIVTRVGYVPLSALELAPSSAAEKR